MKPEHRARLDALVDLIVHANRCCERAQVLAHAPVERLDPRRFERLVERTCPAHGHKKARATVSLEPSTRAPVSYRTYQD